MYVAALRERDVLTSCLLLLDVHPAVAWSARMNSGAMTVEGKSGKRYVKFAFTGCSDIIGQMADGRFLAIECKRPGGWPTDETFLRWQSLNRLSERQSRLLAQRAFLGRVNAANGVGVAVDDVSTLNEVLARNL